MKIVDINMFDNNCKNSLFYAIAANDWKAAQTLIENGASGYYPSLYVSTRCGSVDKVEFMLRHFKSEIGSFRFNNILALAAANGHTEVVRLLLSVEEF